MQIFTDFDGTVTLTDSLVFLLDRYAGESWYEIEDRVDAGTLPEKEGLHQEIALLAAPFQEALSALLAELPVDPGFAGFAALCRERGWPLSILSGGLRPVIEALLEREGLAGIPVHSNDLAFDGDGRWRVVPAATPRIRDLCNHCKTWWLRQAEGPRVYIGDGTTDRCPSSEADLVFAKGGLARWCEKEGIEHVSWERFEEIGSWLKSDRAEAWLEAQGGP